MIDYLKKKLELLADELLDPFWNRLRRLLKELSWAKRAALLAVVVLVVTLIFYWKPLLHLSEDTMRLARIVESGATYIPINASVTKKLHETARRLSETLQPEINNSHNTDPDFSAWTLAQNVAATHGLTDIDRDKIGSLLRNVSWQKTPPGSDPPFIPATGWTVFSLAEIDVPATEAGIRFLLDEQHKDGWWSLFPVNSESKYASTYATAWAVIGLQNQLSKKLLPNTLSTKVASAVSAGSAWLTVHQEKNTVRWKDYPLVSEGHISESISGLVLHTLNKTSPNSMSQINKSWIDELPLTQLTASDYEQNFLWIKTKNNGGRADFYIQVKLPWLLVATVDTYADGDYLHRVKALRWIEELINQESVINAEKQRDSWWRAELLLAIRYVLKSSTSTNSIEDLQHSTVPN